MILNKHGYKRTANELAKELVYYHGEEITLCWQEKIPCVYYDKFTSRENDLVHNAIQNQLARTAKLLGKPNRNRNKEDYR